MKSSVMPVGVLCAVVGTALLMATPTAQADWIQWPASEGGNDHFYDAISVPDGLTWDAAEQSAESLGGYLATLTSGAENEFVFGLVNSPEFWFPSGGHNHGPWLGGLQPPGSQEPAGGWEWITGESWDFTSWHPTQPDNNGNEEAISKPLKATEECRIDAGIRRRGEWTFPSECTGGGSFVSRRSCVRRSSAARRVAAAAGPG